MGFIWRAGPRHCGIEARGKHKRGKKRWSWLDKLVTMSPQIFPTNQSPTTPQKYFVYRLLGLSMLFFVFLFFFKIKLDMFFYYHACKVLEDCLYFFSGLTLQGKF